MFCVWIIIIQDEKTPLQLAQEDVSYVTKERKVEIRKFLESYLQEVHSLFVIYTNRKYT